MTKRWLSPEDAARIGEKNRKAWAGRVQSVEEMVSASAVEARIAATLTAFIEPPKPMDAVERLLHVKGPAIRGEVRRPVAAPTCQKAQVRRTVLPVPTETSECLTFIAWTRLVTFRDRPLFDRVVKIPNERGRAGVSTAILQSIGMRAGFPDYNILAPTRIWSGLYLEAKRIRGGKVEADQMRWRDDLRAFGYYAEICAGADELIAATRKYFVTAGCDRDCTWIDRTSR